MHCGIFYAKYLHVRDAGRCGRIGSQASFFYGATTDFTDAILPFLNPGEGRDDRIILRLEISK